MKTRKLLFLLLITSITIAKGQYTKGIKVEPLLKTDTTSSGQHILYPNTQQGEITLAKITIEPGKSTGWHKHDFPVFAYVQEGTLTVQLENGRTLEFTKDEALAEVIHTYHNGTNHGSKPVVLIAIFLGEKGKALSQPKKE